MNSALQKQVDEGTAPCRCPNCEWTGPMGNLANDLDEVEDLGQRLDPGSVVPVGQCPECLALAYLDEPEPPKGPTGVSQLAGFGAAVLRILQNDQDWSSDTMQELARQAADRGLSGVDGDGNFVAKPQPAQEPARVVADAVELEIRTYRVVWEIDVTASSPEEAAERALTIQRNPESIATVFTTLDDEDQRVVVDLSPIDSN